jgi:hypothetical protein
MLQLKITLKDIKPPIWRQVLVDESMTLLELHDLIQAVFGWENYHLHLFKIGHNTFVNPPDWEEDAYRHEDGNKVELRDFVPGLIPEGGKFNYTYDLGDGWEHQIRVEKILPKDPKVKTPVVLKGRRACPPEDVGGPWGYERYLEIIQDPDHPEHAQYLTWIGGSFDPEAFDLNAANHCLFSRLRKMRLERESSWKIGPMWADLHSVATNGWTEQISPEDKATAQQLPMRRDMITMLNYLLENKVKGTAARGNFPRKHVRGIVAGFVNPPKLDRVIGDHVYKMRTEDEVRDLARLHALASVAGLIIGGESMVWTVTEQGKRFLTLAPEEQVWYLVMTWFRLFNWHYEYDYGDTAFDSALFAQAAVELFQTCEVGQTISIQALSEGIDIRIDFKFNVNNPAAHQHHQNFYIKHVLVFPLSQFGILTQVIEKAVMETYTFNDLQGVRLTGFGKGLLPYVDMRNRNRGY